MKDYWLGIRQQITELGQLIDQTEGGEKLVWGFNSHRFEMHPVASEEEIHFFELKHNCRLPENYRTFLQYCGTGGAGPEFGIKRFPEKVWPGDLSKPLDLSFYPNLDFSEGYAETENVDGPLNDRDGMLGIGNDGQAMYFLVVSGALHGNVLSWDCWNGLGFLSGQFDLWYKRWLECIHLGLRENEAINKLQMGMNLSEVINIPDLNVNYRDQDKKYLYYQFNEGGLELDSDNNICRISSKETSSIGLRGFTVWSERQGKYLG